MSIIQPKLIRNNPQKKLFKLSINDVTNLLISLNLHKYCEIFKNNDVDGKTLYYCKTEDDIKQLGIIITAKARVLLNTITIIKQNENNELDKLLCSQERDDVMEDYNDDNDSTRVVIPNDYKQTKF